MHIDTDMYQKHNPRVEELILPYAIKQATLCSGQEAAGPNHISRDTYDSPGLTKLGTSDSARELESWGIYSNGRLIKHGQTHHDSKHM